MHRDASIHWLLSWLPDISICCSYLMIKPCAQPYILNLWITLNLCVDFLSMYFQVIMCSLAWWYSGRGGLALAGVVFCHGSLTTLLPYFYMSFVKPFVSYTFSAAILCLISAANSIYFSAAILYKEYLYSKWFINRMMCFGHISNVPSCGRLL